MTILPGTITPLALLALAVTLVPALRFAASGKRRKTAYSFTGCPLMSASEIGFFRVLQTAVPNDLVFPQVGMAAVVQPNYAAADSLFMLAFRKISQKRIDFGVCQRESS